MSEATTRTFATLAELNAACRVKRVAKIKIGEKQLDFEVLPLTPAQEAKLAEIKSIAPPIIRGKTQDEDRLNLSDPDYMKRSVEAEIKARALGLYWCVPAFGSAKTGITDQGEVAAFVQECATEDVLNQLWAAVRKSSTVDEAELVNFT